MPYSTITASLSDLLSSVLNLSKSGHTPPTEQEQELKASPDIQKLCNGYINCIYRIQDKAYVLLNALNLENSEKAKILTEHLNSLEHDAKLLLEATDSKEGHVKQGERIARELRASYAEIADMSGTTVEILVGKVKEMVHSAGYTYTSTNGVLDMRRVTENDGPLEEEDLMGLGATGTTPPVVELRVSQPVDIIGSSVSRTINTTPSVSGGSEVICDGSTMMINDTFESQGNARIQRAGPDATSLASTDNPGPASSESNYRTVQIFTRRSSIGEIHATTHDEIEMSQHSAEEQLSQRSFEEIRARPVTVVPGTQPIDLSAAATVPTSVLPFDARRGEHLPRDYWMQAAPVAIIPISGQTPDGGSAASGSVTSGTASNDGILYFVPGRL